MIIPLNEVQEYVCLIMFSMQRRNRLALVALVALAACRKEEAPAPPAVTVQPATRDTSGRELVSYANQKIDTVMVEGMPMPVGLQLIQPPSSIPFLTYVPNNMVFETKKTATCEGHYFIAAFGGKRNDDAYLLLCIYPPNIDQTKAIELLKKQKADLEKPNTVVKVELKLHGARYYSIVQHYPAEYGDGFPPRSQMILDEWQWLD